MQPSSKPLCVDLLRHGELQTPGLFCARKDEPLSRKGMRQLNRATQSGSWDTIISSPSLRCLAFAQTLAQSTATQLIIKADFQEMNFGQWLGLPYQAIWDKEPEQLKQLWQSPESFVAPEGESMQHFIERVQSGWQDILGMRSKRSILIVTHAGVIRSILADTLGIPYNSTPGFHIGYGCFARLYCYPDGIYSLRGLGFRKVHHAEGF